MQLRRTHLGAASSLNIPQTIADYANASGVDPNVALELATVESSLNQSAVSSAGAVGIMQLLPSSFPGVNIYDAGTNIQTGIAYLASLIAQFGGDYPSALAAYNWGPSRVAAAQSKYGSGWFATIPGSVQNYVDEILGNAGSQYSASVSIPGITDAGSDSSAPAATAVDASGAELEFDPVSGGYVDASGNAATPVATIAASGISMQAVVIGLAVVLGIGLVLNLAE